MRKVVLILSLIVGLLAPVAALASPASARCAPPDGTETIYRFKDKSLVYYSTNVASDWVIFPQGGSISYSKSKTAQLSVSTTATVSTEANAIFAKASASLGVTVGGSWSKSQTWTYSANVPADRAHRYRLHMYHYAANFSVRKYGWSYANCNWTVPRWSSWQAVHHVPAKASRNVWRLDKAAA